MGIEDDKDRLGAASDIFSSWDEVSQNEVASEPAIDVGIGDSWVKINNESGSGSILKVASTH